MGVGGEPDSAHSDERRAGEANRFVPVDFVPATLLRTERFWLEPLGPEHNEADYAAWRSSVAHIKATPGFEDRRWPHPMTLDENRDDLVMHARDFDRRVGFTYTVRDTETGDVIGCVYIYPSHEPGVDASVRSWVRASNAALDEPLARTVARWLAGPDWPFDTVRYR